jgi:hypothetical protein
VILYVVKWVDSGPLNSLYKLIYDGAVLAENRSLDVIKSKVVQVAQRMECRAVFILQCDSQESYAEARRDMEEHEQGVEDTSAQPPTTH